MKRLLTIGLLCIVLSASAQVKQVHILSINDMHAGIERMPQFAAVADSLRAIYPDLLILSAGDNRTGNPINDIDPVSCRPMVTLMNEIGFNYSALGNHEFDGGVDGLRTVINNSYCKYLCANLFAPDSLRLHYQPFTFVDVDGVKVGILGLVQVDEETGHPDAHPKFVGKLKFRQLNEVAREYAWMRRECDVFILLTHNGIMDDVKLAEIMPEADFIIGGHSHTIIDPCQMVNNVMITQNGRDVKYATFITVKVENGKVVDREAQLIDVAHYPSINAHIQEIVDKFSDNETLKRVLTHNEEFFNKEELGCLMADAVRFETGADIAIQNNGGVRYETKPSGDFTVNDVYRLDPFGNEIVEFNLSGDEVVEMLAAICRADEYGPAYVSGLNYKIILGKGGHTDVKKVEVTMPDGSKFDRTRTYRVIMSTYVASVAEFESEDEGRNLFIAASDVLMDFLAKQQSINYAGQKRVTVINK